MVLDLKLVLIAGVVWGIVGVILLLAAGFIGPILGLQVEGLSLATFALLFAGVHFVYLNPGGLLADLIGGAIAGVIAALILFLAARFLVSAGGAMTTSNLIAAIAAGLGGAFGMVIIERTRRGGM